MKMKSSTLIAVFVLFTYSAFASFSNDPFFHLQHSYTRFYPSVSLDEETEVKTNEIVRTSTRDTVSGTCGTYLTWSMEGDTLTISGEGEMTSKCNYSSVSGKIKYVVVNQGATSVVKNGFQSLRALLKVTLPISMKRIGRNAFGSCPSLAEINLPDGITNIDSYAFYRCARLDNVALPTGITSIEEGTFAECTSLKNVTLSEGIQTIGTGAFNKCVALENIILPNSMTTIGEYAFSVCSELTGVVFKDSVTKIDGYAFAECPKLSMLSIPNSLTTLGRYAFYGCSSLTHIDFPSGLHVIEEFTFFNCSSLTQLTLPSSITRVGNIAFGYCDNLASVSIMDGVLEFGSLAFASCSHLQYVRIPKSLTTIDFAPFGDCGSLKEIEVDPENENYIAIEGVLFTRDKKTLIQFPAGSESTNYSIPYGVTLVGKDAFIGCYKLADIIIPETVETLDVMAFRRCTNIKKIRIPKSVTMIEMYVFLECEKLRFIEVDLDNPAFCSIDGVLFSKNKKKIISYPPANVSDHYSIPNDVDVIENYTFVNCVNLKAVDIPKSVGLFGYHIFDGCTSLRTVNFFGLVHPVVNMNETTFSGCSDSVKIQVRVDYTNDSFCGKTVTKNMYEVSVKRTSGWLFYYVIQGSSLEVAGDVKGDKELLDELFVNSHMINEATSEVASISDIIANDVVLIPCFVVRVTGIDNEEWFINSGSIIDGHVVKGNAELLSQIMNDCHLLDMSLKVPEEVTGNSLLNSDVNLISCNLVLVNGVSWYTIHGEPLADGIVTGDKQLLGELFMNNHMIDEITFKAVNISDIITNDIVLVPHHIITWSGIIEGQLLVSNGTKFNSLKSLSGYVESDDYLVADASTHGVIDGDSEILRDLKLIITKRQSAVVIEFEKTKEVNVTEISVELSQIVGVSEERIFVQLKYDDEGYILSVIIYVEDDGIAETVVKAIDDLGKKGTCDTGVLCKSKKAYIFKDEKTIEAAGRNVFSVFFAFSIILLFFPN